MNDKLKTHVFDFTPDENGGESLSLTTVWYDNGDGDAFTNQKLTLQSYSNSASFKLVGASLTPAILRELANELESAAIQVNALLKKPV